MKKCIDEKIGQMISFYEFDKLSPEDKQIFEDHLLKCDACYQDVYEFRSAVKTMKKYRKSYLRVLKEKMSIIDRIAEFLFPTPIPKYRYALATVAILVISFIFIRIYQTKDKSVMITDTSTQDSTGMQQKPLIPHAPDYMELRAAGDTLQVVDQEGTETEIEFSVLLSKSMKASLSEDKKSIRFSWSSVEGVLQYHIDLIKKEKILRITPTGGIQEQQFQYKITSDDIKNHSEWRLYGESETGKLIVGEKKFDFE